MIRRTLRLLAILTLFVSAAVAQTTSDYNTLVQKGKTQLQAGSADLALASGEAAIKMNADRWEGYALAAGALMNLKRYEDAADKFSQAIDRAPEAKQPALRDLRRQCLLAESGASPVPKEAAPPTTSQAEIVLWKSIENSTNPKDFQSYLDQYPKGTFVVLARRHLAEAKAQPEQAPPPDVLYNNALRDYKGTASDLAIQEFSDYVRFYPNTDLAGNCYFYLGEIQFRQGNYDQAVQSYNQVLQNFPTGNKAPSAQLKKGFALIELGKKDDGVQELRHLIQRYPHSPEALQARERLGTSNARK